MSKFFRSVIGSALVGLLLPGCSSRHEDSPIDLAAVKADLQTVSRARILFAHQSVGRNLLQGIKELSDETGVPLRIQDVSATSPDAGPGLFHANVGENGEPLSKIEGFKQLVGSAASAPYNVAALKFCYADLAADARDKAGLLERYSSAMKQVEASSPGIHLLHVTSPLRGDPPGLKSSLMRMLGKTDGEDAENVERNAYNRALLASLKPANVFDIARVESTYSDGTRSSITRDGATVYTLATEYTNDGGHLNEHGRRRVAAVFLHSLALAANAPAH